MNKKSPNPGRPARDLPSHVLVELETLRKQVVELSHRLEDARSEIDRLSTVSDNNAQIFQSGIKAHDIMIFAIDQIVLDMVRGMVKKKDDGDINYDHYVALARQSEEAPQEPVGEPAAAELAPEAALEPAPTPVEESRHPSGARIFGGDL